MIKFTLSQKIFTLPETLKKKVKSWMKCTDPKWTKLPEGAIMYPKETECKYHLYNAVWINPETEEIIDKFIFEFTDDYYDEYEYLIKLTRARVDILLDQMKKGFVFTDDDKFTKKNINQKNNEIYYKWDPSTHYLNKFQKDYPDALMYSKNVGLSNDQERMTYLVHRPVKINGVWTCKVTITSCWSHKANGKSYGKEKSSGYSLADAWGGKLKDVKGKMVDGLSR